MSKLSPEIKKLIAKCNDKHVLVIQAVLSGDYNNKTEAYLSQYPDSTNVSASDSVYNLLRIPDNRALYEAMKEEKIIGGILKRNEAMAILSDMARTNIGDIAIFDEVDVETADGDIVRRAVWSFKNSENMTEGQLRSIMEIKASPFGSSIKLHDQKGAIKQLAEMQGWNEAKKLDLTASVLPIAGDVLYKKGDV